MVIAMDIPQIIEQYGFVDRKARRSVINHRVK
jgi:hypothetical protein